jgi:hypothetical protein
VHLRPESFSFCHFSHILASLIFLHSGDAEGSKAFAKQVASRKHFVSRMAKGGLDFKTYADLLEYAKKLPVPHASAGKTYTLGGDARC